MKTVHANQGRANASKWAHDFTDDWVASLPFTPSGQATYSDTNVKCLRLRVGTRTKAWATSIWKDGREISSTHKPANRLEPLMSVDAARNWALRTLLDVDEGKVVIKESHETVALADALKWLLQRLDKQERSAGTKHNYEYWLTRCFGDWMDRKLVTITTTELEDRHTEIAAEVRARTTRDGGKTLANRGIETFINAWKTAAKRHPKLGASPASGVILFKERSRKYDVRHDAFRANAADVARLINPIRRLANRFLMYSPLRESELLNLRWGDIDTDRIAIRCPKGGVDRAYELPLCTQLVAILAELRPLSAAVQREGCDWLFPSTKAANGRLAEAQGWRGTPKVKGKSERRVALTWNEHRYRHAWRNYAHEAGVDFVSAETLMNHMLSAKIGDSAAAYLDPPFYVLAAGMQTTADFISGILAGTALIEPPRLMLTAA